jgi:hypothetical protein
MEKEFEKKMRMYKEQLQSRNPENLELITADIQEHFIHYVSMINS